MLNHFGTKAQLTFQLSWAGNTTEENKKGHPTFLNGIENFGSCIQRSLLSRFSAATLLSDSPRQRSGRGDSAREEAGTPPFEELWKHAPRRRFSTQTQQKGRSTKECQAREGMADVSETASHEDGQKEASFLWCHATAVGVWLDLHALRRDVVHKCETRRRGRGDGTRKHAKM
ncbi:UNVERIFIED_CONTAM: hypothetical protein HHA_226925 [Hammondia hammondi]|eukprot:XP_008882065.1 hypothetical protein HHA_226925 [Hammondia hammondi]